MSERSDVKSHIKSNFHLFIHQIRNPFIYQVFIG